MPLLPRQSLGRPLVLAAASPPDRHGYFSLGTSADYVAAVIGHVPFFLEVNRQMPRTFGLNQIPVRVGDDRGPQAGSTARTTVRPDADSISSAPWASATRSRMPTTP